jgi:hypothetical protein
MPMKYPLKYPKIPSRPQKNLSLHPKITLFSKIKLWLNYFKTNKLRKITPAKIKKLRSGA